MRGSTKDSLSVAWSQPNGDLRHFVDLYQLSLKTVATGETIQSEQQAGQSDYLFENLDHGTLYQFTVSANASARLNLMLRHRSISCILPASQSHSAAHVLMERRSLRLLSTRWSGVGVDSAKVLTHKGKWDFWLAPSTLPAGFDVLCAFTVISF